jgi:hypothetical protein
MNKVFYIAQVNRFRSVDSVGRELPPRSAPVCN